MAMSNDLAVVAGGGGFIGGHLVANLVEDGFRVRSVDVKPLDEWYVVRPEAENVVADLRVADTCRDAVTGAREVYNLAADQGGMGLIENNNAPCQLAGP